ncbi:hypothetical protein [Gryllotalpicola koreensis]|uniref:Fibronectin type-III domain-containing protein n=1 Tax=Gryllotalpicola koreensis TaxID=993086 RepID=A0ABP8A376_9MICO
MPNSFMVRLRQHDTATLARGRVVPSTGLTVDQKLSDATVVTANVSPLIFAGLTLPMVCAVEWSTGAEWGMAPGGRHIVTDSDYDDTDKGRVYQLQFQQYVPWMLDHARVLAGDNTTAGQRTLSGTPGAILTTLIAEAKARGWGANIAVDFDATHTSDGQPWAQTTGGIQFGVGTSVWAVLQSLISSGVCEIAVDGTDATDTLHVYNPGHGTDRTGAGSAPLVALSNPTDAPVKWSLGNVYTRLGVTMDGGATFLQDVAGAYSALGPLEGWLSQGGVSDQDTAQTLVGQAASDAKAPALQTNLSDLASTAKYLPWRDYTTGDLTKYRTRGGWQSGRVSEFALTVDDNGTVSVQNSFGPPMLDTTAKLAQIVSSQLGGVKVGGNGRPASTDPTLDTRVPSTPSGLDVNASAYWGSGGQPLGRIDATWDAVQTATDGSALAVDDYEVWILDVDAGETTYKRQAATVDPVFSLVDLPIGGTYRISVLAATTYGGRSDRTDPIEVTIGLPTVTLGAPSTPILATRRGIVLAAWDGKDANGATMPAYFWRLVAQTTGALAEPIVDANGDPVLDEDGNPTYDDSSVVWTPDGAQLTDAGVITLSGYDVGSTLYVRFMAYDHAGQPTVFSDVASIVVEGIDAPDLEANAVTANTIAAGAITVDKVSSDFGASLDLSSNESINLLAGSLDGTQARFAFDDTGATITADEDSPYAVHVGEADLPDGSSTEGVQIEVNGVVVSWWDAQAMHVSNFVGEQVQLGNHVLQRIDGGTVVKAV